MFGAAPVPNPGADLYWAAAKGNTVDVQRLLQENAPVDFNYADGATPLYIAASNGHEEVVKLLLEAGADKDAETHNPHGSPPLFTGITALFMAAHYDREAVVKLLLAAGAHTATKVDGKTALDYAREQGRTSVVTAFEEAAAAATA